MSGAFVPVCLGRSSPPGDADFEYISADLCDPHFADRLPNKIDAVIHLAQGEDYADFPKRALSVFRVNVAATASLLEWAQAAGAAHFVLASTGGVYGLGSRSFKETDAVNIAGRLAYYFSTKYSAEIIANGYCDYLRIISLRYFFIYGANQNPSMLMPRLINAVCSGRPLSLAGEFGMRLNPIDVRDAAAATISALAMETSKTINVAGADVLSMRELGQIIASELGKPAFFELTSVAERRDLVADISLMSTHLGAPRIGIKEGIAQMCRAVAKV